MAPPKQYKASSKKRPPAKTPEARENQVIALAYDLAEKQIAEGTASSQVITHFLKLGTLKEQLDREKLQEEVKYLKAKTGGIEAQGRIEELYKEALNAMRKYSGQVEDDEYD